MNNSAAEGLNILSEENSENEQKKIDADAEANLLSAQNEQKRIEVNLLCAQNEQKRINADYEIAKLNAQTEQKRIDADYEIAKLNAAEAKINTEAEGK